VAKTREEALKWLKEGAKPETSLLATRYANFTSECKYLDVLDDIIHTGTMKENRTGVNSLTIIGDQCRYDLSKGFPLFTTKNVWFKGVVHELLWFLSGSTNIKYLVDNGVNIWNADAYRWYREREDGRERGPYADKILSEEEFIAAIKEGGERYDNPLSPTLGELGFAYGRQWKKWPAPDKFGCYDDDDCSIDQVSRLIDGIKTDPYSRRHIITGWNPGYIDRAALPPCHVMSMWSVLEGKLHCHMVQRSCDMFLGVPFNVASYALLTHMIAQVCRLEVGDLIHTLHDAHIYETHLEAAKEQISRTPIDLPELWLNPDIKNIDDFKFEDIKVKNYNPHPTIKAELVR